MRIYLGLLGVGWHHSKVWLRFDGVILERIFAGRWLNYVV